MYNTYNGKHKITEIDARSLILKSLCSSVVLKVAKYALKVIFQIDYFLNKNLKE